MRIALDAMGGDHAPSEVVRGAVDAALEHKVEVVLVGRQEVVQKELSRYDCKDSRLAVVDAGDIVGMAEPPTTVLRNKRDSSIMVGMNLLKGGDVSAFVSAGNTGAIMAAALHSLGKMKGIERPAIATVYPSPSGLALFLDVGANTDCKPTSLVQFAQMGSIYMEKAFGIDNPRIGLLSNGEEETKGNQLVREAHRLLKKTKLNFIGNLEGRDIHRGIADVIVTDGFTGNVVVKVSEGFSETLVQLWRQALTNKLHFRMAAVLLSPAFREIAQWLADYTEYGGAPLLGVKGNVIIAHGRSDAKAIKNAVRVAKQAVQEGMVEAIRTRVE